MAHRKFTVLFLGTHNASRSLLAEAAANNLAVSQGKLQAFSAGSDPQGIHPLTLEFLRRNRFPTDDLRSKSWEEFARDGAPALDFVFTVCDRVAGETCPVWPGHPTTAHWGMTDPAQAQGEPEAVMHAFAETFHELRRRIELFASLPFEKLDRLAIEEHARGIGRG